MCTLLVNEIVHVLCSFFRKSHTKRRRGPHQHRSLESRTFKKHATKAGKESILLYIYIQVASPSFSLKPPNPDLHFVYHLRD
jgi:hypothetical protein